MPIRFGSFQLDEQRFELRRGGTLINVQPRVLETIVFLLQRRNRLVTKEELIAGPWKGMNVSDTALSQAISQARAALSEDPKAPKFIETIRGKGFRFCGEVSGDPQADEAGPTSPRLRPFIGRRREIDRLLTAAGEARAGHGNIVLIHGPAGIGKTRLAQWFASQQRDAGSEICWGGCREGQSAPPFWPWPEVLHRYSEDRDIATLERLARGLQQDLVAVAPELREALGATSTSEANESRERAASVLDAIAGFLRRAAAQGPLTLILEDLHLADDAALQLLEVVARSIADTELMVLGTFRRAEAASRATLRAACEGALPHVYAIGLEGLTVDEVRQWLSTTTATPLPDTLVEAFHFSTEGLPLLVEALADGLPDRDTESLAASSDWRPELSGRVKEILGRRLHQLDRDTLRLLKTAAVCGEEFPIGVLAAATNEPLNSVLPLLEQAHQQGVLKAATRGSMRFAHALHQNLLYQELEAPERRQLHAAVARAFADQLGHRPETIIPTAHHFLEALPHGDLDQAVFYAQRAAEWARARHAYARAAEYYQRALDVLERGPANPQQFAELLLALGQTQIVAGAVEEATATLELSFELTRAHGDYARFCRALLMWFQLRRESVAVDSTFHAHIAEALANVTDKDATYAQLLVARGMAMALLKPASERTAWVQEALELTRGTPNARARLDVLRGALRCYTRLADGSSRLTLAEEMLELAQHLRSPENELEARQWKVQFLLELGRGEEFAQQVSDYAQRAAIVRTPDGSWTANMHRVGQLFLSGDLLESERLAREASAVGEKLIGVSAAVHLVAQLFQVGLELSGPAAERVLRDAQTGAERILAIAPNYHVMHTLRARAALGRGQPRAAQHYLASVVDPSYTPPDPLDGTALVALVNIASMAAELGNAAAAARVLQLLETHDGLHAVSATGSVYLGPVCHWLGRLCLTLGRSEEAARYLERALRASRESGSVGYRAWSEYYLAQALHTDVPAARTLLESSTRAAHRFGLGRLAAK